MVFIIHFFLFHLGMVRCRSNAEKSAYACQHFPLHFPLLFLFCLFSLDTLVCRFIVKTRFSLGNACARTHAHTHAYVRNFVFCRTSTHKIHTRISLIHYTVVSQTVPRSILFLLTDHSSYHSGRIVGFWYRKIINRKQLLVWEWVTFSNYIF